MSGAEKALGIDSGTITLNARAMNANIAVVRFAVREVIFGSLSARFLVSVYGYA